LGKPLGFECAQILLNIFGWILQAGSVPFGSGANDVGCEVQLVSQEFVGMLRFNAIRSQDLWREILEVEGYDHVCPCADRSGKDVPVIGIGE
jgi:hypothetical protein